MSLFTAGLSRLTQKDLVNFLATKEPEGLRVEYKSGFPVHENLARAVAAMANAEGGLILLGVPTDAQNKPINPTGIPVEGNIPDRIANICAAKIRPAISPEIRMFELEGLPEKCVVLLRVPASQLAPHYLPDFSGEPLIPVRVDGRISHADVPTIEALLQRRRGDVVAAKRSLARQDSPSTRNAFKEKTGRALTEEEAFFVRIAVFATLGPEKLRPFTHDLDEQMRELLPYRCPFDTIEMGWVPGRPMTRRISGFEVHRKQGDVTYGCVGLERPITEGVEKPVCILVRVTEGGAVQFSSIVLRNDFQLGTLVRDLRNTLTFAKSVFEIMGYFGECELELVLENVNPSGGGLDLFTGDGRSYKYQGGQHVQVGEGFDVLALGESMSELVKGVIRRVLREGNVAVTEDFLDYLTS